MIFEFGSGFDGMGEDDATGTFEFFVFGDDEASTDAVKGF